MSARNLFSVGAHPGSPMADSHLVAIVSDFHAHGAGEAALEYALSRGAREVRHNGDRSIDPDFSATGGRNLLRDAKNQAKERGGDYREAEALLWDGPDRDTLVSQWLGILEPTVRLHRHAEDLVLAGRLPQMLDTGGNDADKDHRLLTAYWARERATGQARGPSLLDVTQGSFAYRTIGGVEARRVGPTLELLIPYTEDKDDKTLAFYANAAAAATAANRDASAIVILAHQPPDERLRKESRNGWFRELYGAVRSSTREGVEMVHVSGHAHKIPPPYVFEDTGALLVPAGYGKAEGLQRVVLIDYADPLGARSYVDVRFNRKGLVSPGTEGRF